MFTVELLVYVRASLPAPPARVLEIGAGDGALARALAEVGHEVTAIDPGAEPGGDVQPIPLLDVEGRFDAAVAILSLHHIDPLRESCAHLATLLQPGAVLIIDEHDSLAYDARAAAWWLAQRRALGEDEAAEPESMVADLRHHIHSATEVMEALAPHFVLGAPMRGPFLHRFKLRDALYAAEVDLIAAGRLPAVGWRQVAVRRPD